MGAEHQPTYAKYKTCEECGERIPAFMSHLHGEWAHPSLWRRLTGWLTRREQ